MNRCFRISLTIVLCCFLFPAFNQSLLGQTRSVVPDDELNEDSLRIPLRAFDVSYRDIIFQEWKGNSWENTDKQELMYDRYGNVRIQNYFSWESTWVPISQSIYKYDDQGNIVERISKSWFSNSWENTSRSIYFYNARGSVTEILSQLWIALGWNNSSKISYTYDIRGNRIASHTSQWDDNTWMYRTQRYFTFDSAHHITVATVIRCRRGLCENRDLFSYSYNENGNRIAELRKAWNGVDWFPTSRRVSEYDTANRMTLTKTEHYDNGGWSLQSQISFSHDSVGNLIRQESKLWEQNTLRDYSRNTYTYDSFSHEIELLWQYRADSAGWVNVWRRKTSYQQTTDASEERYLPSAFFLYQNYPNPFNPITVIRYELAADAVVTLKVFNILGQEVAELVSGEQLAGVHNISFDGSLLSSGTYFYRLVAASSDNPSDVFVEIKRLMLIK